MASSASPSAFQASQSHLPADLSPSSLDTIPVLTSILTRLQNAPTDSATTLSSPHQSFPLSHSLSQSQSQSQPQHIISSPAYLPISQSQSLGHSLTSITTAEHKEKFSTFSATPLTAKEIPSATDALKHRLQKARMMVKELPDIGRGIEEQESEIRELEARIEEQRMVLERLRRLGLRLEGEEEEVEDMEN